MPSIQPCINTPAHSLYTPSTPSMYPLLTLYTPSVYTLYITPHPFPSLANLNNRPNIITPSPILCPCPNLLQSTARAANPKHKFLVSSNTSDKNRNPRSSVSAMSFAGTLRNERGASMPRRARASCSGGVVVRARLADCSATNVTEDAVIASLTCMCWVGWGVHGHGMWSWGCV